MINDPLAIVYFLYPDICQGFDSYTDIAREGIALGQSIVDSHDFYHQKANSHILTRVDTKYFWQDFLATLLGLPKTSITKDLESLE